MMIGFFCLSLAMSLLRDLVPTRFSVFIPIPMAMAIPFYVGASVAIDICIGALIKAYWYWTSPLDAPGKVRSTPKPPSRPLDMSWVSSEGWYYSSAVGSLLLPGF